MDPAPAGRVRRGRCAPGSRRRAGRITRRVPDHATRVGGGVGDRDRPGAAAARRRRHDGPAAAGPDARLHRRRRGLEPGRAAAGEHLLPPRRRLVQRRALRLRRGPGPLRDLPLRAALLPLGGRGGELVGPRARHPRQPAAHRLVLRRSRGAPRRRLPGLALPRPDLPRLSLGERDAARALDELRQRLERGRPVARRRGTGDGGRRRDRPCGSRLLRLAGLQQPHDPAAEVDRRRRELRRLHGRLRDAGGLQLRDPGPAGAQGPDGRLCRRRPGGGAERRRGLPGLERHHRTGRRRIPPRTTRGSRSPRRTTAGRAGPSRHRTAPTTRPRSTGSIRRWP